MRAKQDVTARMAGARKSDFTIIAWAKRSMLMSYRNSNNTVSVDKLHG